MEIKEIECLKGRIAVEVFTNKNENGEWCDELTFVLDNGDSVRLYHSQNYGESVYIESIVGDLSDLIGNPIIMCEETIKPSSDSYGTQTWTFYKFATIKGYVDVRWFGESNGHYSESVDITINGECVN